MMADTNEQKDQGGGAAGADVRSENLLPAGRAGSGDDSSDDGRFEVAEEVNLDEQSDATRRVGKLPEGSAADALADVYKSGDKK
jgi:hypothetical protein